MTDIPASETGGVTAATLGGPPAGLETHVAPSASDAGSGQPNTPARLYPKHPWAQMPGKSGAFQLSSGDRFVHDINGRRGWADEFTSDGDALVCWDDGSYGTIKWNHMSPERVP